MDDYITGRNSPEAINVIEEKEKVVKRFDFESDIDWGKSDKCYVALNNRYVEFLYKELYLIIPNDVRINIFGEFISTQDEIQLIPKLSEKVNDLVKRAHVIVEKALDPSEVDLIDIEFDTNEYSNVCLRFENQFFYDISKMVTNNELPLKNEYFESIESIRYAIFSHMEYCAINKTMGRVLEDGEIIRDGNKHSSRKYIINLRKGDIYIGNKRERFQNDLLKINEKCYLSIACNEIHEDQDIHFKAKLNIKKIIYGKDTGYIYFKPFIVSEPGSTRIVLVYKGTPYLQYLDSNGIWKSISSKQRINDMDSVNLRLSMSGGDRIYELIAVQDK